MDTLIEKIELTKLKIEPGEVLAVTLKLEDTPSMEMISTFKNRLSANLGAPVMVFVCQPGESVDFTTIKKEDDDVQA